MRRPVAAAVTSRPSWWAAWTHGVGRAVGHAGVQRDLDPVAVGDVPRAGLQQRVGEEGAELVAVAVVEVTLDEHDVGDVGHRRGQPERRAPAAMAAARGSLARPTVNRWIGRGRAPLARPYGARVRPGAGDS